MTALDKLGLLSRQRELIALIEYANRRIQEIDIQLKQIDEEQTDEH